MLQLRYYVIMAILLVLMVAGDSSGQGVQRRIVIHTSPPGALVKIDDNEIGLSPVSTSFIYYGTRKIQLIKPGYETMTFLQPIRAPWYQYPLLDFFSEHVIPGERRDVRVLTYVLQPKVVVPTDQLLSRAEQLRANGQASAVPGGAVVPTAPRAEILPPAAVPK